MDVHSLSEWVIYGSRVEQRALGRVRCASRERAHIFPDSHPRRARQRTGATPCWLLARPLHRDEFVDEFHQLFVATGHSRVRCVLAIDDYGGNARDAIAAR